jgi:hypothetical protein
MAIDALSSVPLGRSDTGEAVVLGKGNFEDFTRDILKIRQKEGEERKQTNAEISKLLNEDFKSNWAQDNINVFTPMLQNFKEKTIDLYRKNNGKLSSVDVWALNNEQDKIKQQIAASNSLYAEEQKKNDFITAHPDKVDAEESRKVRTMYANPMAFPELKKEVDEKFGGNIINWRLANAARFDNVAAYDMNTDVDSFVKSNLTIDYKNKDKEGKPIYEKTPSGTWSALKESRFDPEKSKLAFNEFWNRKDYKGKRLRENSLEGAKEHVLINPDGSVSAQTPIGLEMIKTAKLNPSMSEEQKQNELAKSYAIEFAKPKGYKLFSDDSGKSPQAKTLTSSEDKKAFTRTSDGYSVGGFTFIDEPNRNAIEVPTLLGPKKIEAQKALRVNTEATSALPKEILITSGKYKGQLIAPNVVMKTKDGKYYVEGSVTESANPKDPNSVATKKIIAKEVTPTELRSSFNISQSNLDEMFGTSSQKATPSNKPTGTGKKKLPGT